MHGADARGDDAMTHVRNGFATVRPYLHGPAALPDFVQQVFDAQVIERHGGGPTLLKIGDGALWIEAGELPPDIEAWTGAVYVYVADVDAVFARAVAHGAAVVAAPEDKPYAERQCGFTDAGGNTWWVSTYVGDRDGPNTP
jgi:PhnB protein